MHRHRDALVRSTRGPPTTTRVSAKSSPHLDHFKLSLPSSSSRPRHPQALRKISLCAAITAAVEIRPMPCFKFEQETAPRNKFGNGATCQPAILGPEDRARHRSDGPDSASTFDARHTHLHRTFLMCAVLISRRKASGPAMKSATYLPIRRTRVSEWARIFCLFL